MDILPSDIRQAVPVEDISTQVKPEPPLKRVRRELRAAGSVLYDMYLPETFYLPHVIGKDEHIKGAVYGRYDEGRGVLVVTDRRILFIDRKPLFTKRVNITFDIVSGVSRTRTGPIGSVTLRTRDGVYTLQTLNQKNARNFVEYVATQHLRKPQIDHGYELY